MQGVCNLMLNDGDLEFINWLKESLQDFKPLSKEELSLIATSWYKNFGCLHTCYLDIEVENKHWYYNGYVKSHNSVSQLVNSSSGIHTRWSPYYIRTVRIDKKDPIAKFMIDIGIPCEDDIYKPDHQYVFSFPIK